MKYLFTAVIIREGKFYVAHCPELGVTGQGTSIEGSRENLKEAVALYLREEAPAEVPHLSEPPFVTTFEIVA